MDMEALVLWSGCMFLTSVIGLSMLCSLGIAVGQRFSLTIVRVIILGCCSYFVGIAFKADEDYKADCYKLRSMLMYEVRGRTHFLITHALFISIQIANI